MSKLADILESTNSGLLSKCVRLTEIILVRHGQTYCNTTHTIQGQTDSKLTSIGMYGAVTVGQKLYKLHKYQREISAVYASPLGRAKHTVQLIMKQFQDKNNKNIDIEYDNRLKERHFGDLQGLKTEKIISENPKLYENVFGNAHFKAPGKNGESQTDVLNRASNFFAEISCKHNGQRILVVTHGGVIRAMLNDILSYNKVQSKTFYVKNCAVNIIQRDPNNGKWYVSIMGDDNYGNLKELNNENKANNLTHLAMGFIFGCAVTAFILKTIKPSD